MFVMFSNKHKHSSYEEQGSEFAVVSNGMEDRKGEREERKRERIFSINLLVFYRKF